MPKHVVVTLDEQEFNVPALNMAQLQEVAELIAAGTASSTGGFGVLKIALRRATPQPDYETFAPTLDEVGNAIAAILKMSGLQKANPTPLKMVETS